jgi:hypothetical protein
MPAYVGAGDLNRPTPSATAWPSPVIPMSLIGQVDTEALAALQIIYHADHQ